MLHFLKDLVLNHIDSHNTVNIFQAFIEYTTRHI